MSSSKNTKQVDQCVSSRGDKLRERSEQGMVKPDGNVQVISQSYPGTPAERSSLKNESSRNTQHPHPPDDARTSVTHLRTVAQETRDILSQLPGWTKISLKAQPMPAASLPDKPKLINISNSAYTRLDFNSSEAQKLLKNISLIGKAFDNVAVKLNAAESVPPSEVGPPVASASLPSTAAVDNKCSSQPTVEMASSPTVGNQFTDILKLVGFDFDILNRKVPSHHPNTSSSSDGALPIDVALSRQQAFETMALAARERSPESSPSSKNPDARPRTGIDSLAEDSINSKKSARASGGRKNSAENQKGDGQKTAQKAPRISGPHSNDVESVPPRDRLSSISSSSLSSLDFEPSPITKPLQIEPLPDTVRSQRRSRSRSPSDRSKRRRIGSSSDRRRSDLQVIASPEPLMTLKIDKPLTLEAPRHKASRLEDSPSKHNNLRNRRSHGQKEIRLSHRRNKSPSRSRSPSLHRSFHRSRSPCSPIPTSAKSSKRHPSRLTQKRLTPSPLRTFHHRSISPSPLFPGSRAVTSTDVFQRSYSDQAALLLPTTFPPVISPPTPVGELTLPFGSKNLSDWSRSTEDFLKRIGKNPSRCLPSQEEQSRSRANGMLQADLGAVRYSDLDKDIVIRKQQQKIDDLETEVKYLRYKWKECIDYIAQTSHKHSTSRH